MLFSRLSNTHYVVGEVIHSAFCSLTGPSRLGPNLLSIPLLTKSQAKIATLSIHPVLHVFFSHPLTFSGTFLLVSDSANRSGRCAIEDTRFMPRPPTACRGKISLQQLSDLECGDLAKSNYHFLFSTPLNLSLMLTSFYPLGCIYNPHIFLNVYNRFLHQL